MKKHCTAFRVFQVLAAPLKLAVLVGGIAALMVYVNYTIDCSGLYQGDLTNRTIVDLHGWGTAAEQLSQLARRGEWAAMGSVITDPMLEAFAVSGKWADLPAIIQSRYAGRLLDRVALYLPYTPGHDDSGWRAVATGLRG